MRTWSFYANLISWRGILDLALHGSAGPGRRETLMSCPLFEREQEEKGLSKALY